MGYGAGNIYQGGGTGGGGGGGLTPGDVYNIIRNSLASSQYISLDENNGVITINLNYPAVQQSIFANINVDNQFIKKQTNGDGSITIYLDMATLFSSIINDNQTSLNNTWTSTKITSYISSIIEQLETGIMNFVGYISTTDPNTISGNPVAPGTLWYNSSATGTANLPTNFPIIVSRWDGTQWNANQSYTAGDWDVWFNVNDTVTYYWFAQMWHVLNFDIDMSNYYTIEQVNTLLQGYTPLFFGIENPTPDITPNAQPNLLNNSLPNVNGTGFIQEIFNKLAGLWSIITGSSLTVSQAGQQDVVYNPLTGSKQISISGGGGAAQQATNNDNIYGIDTEGVIEGIVRGRYNPVPSPNINELIEQLKGNSIGNYAGYNSMFCRVNRNIGTELPDFLGTSDIWRGIAVGNGLIVCLGEGGNVAVKTIDGGTWSYGTMPMTSSNWSCLRFLGNKFIALNSGTTIMAISDDGQNWDTNYGTPAPYQWRDIAFGNNVYVAISSGYNVNVNGGVDYGVAYSYDLANWTLLTSALPPDAIYGTTLNDWRSLAFGNGVFCAMSRNGKTSVSANGIAWSQGDELPPPTVNQPVHWHKVIFGGNKFVAVNYSSTLGNSIVAVGDNGQSWEAIPLSATGFTTVDYGGSGFIVQGGNLVLFTEDFDAWTTTELNTSFFGIASVYAEGRFTIIGGLTGGGFIAPAPTTQGIKIGTNFDPTLSVDNLRYLLLNIAQRANSPFDLDDGGRANIWLIPRTSGALTEISDGTPITGVDGVTYSPKKGDIIAGYQVYQGTQWNNLPFFVDYGLAKLNLYQLLLLYKNIQSTILCIFNIPQDKYKLLYVVNDGSSSSATGGDINLYWSSQTTQPAQSGSQQVPGIATAQSKINQFNMVALIGRYAMYQQGQAGGAMT